MKRNLFIRGMVSWITVIAFSSVNICYAAPLYKDTLRPPSTGVQDVAAIAKDLQERFAKITRGALIFDIDKTLSERNALFAPPMRDTLIKLLQQGLKLVITTGQPINLQHTRIVEDVLYEVDAQGSLKDEPKEDRRYRPLPASLLKNLIIYANEGTQKYTYNADGEYVEDLDYRRGLFTNKKIEEASGQKGGPLTSEEVLARDKEVKEQIKGILKDVIYEIHSCQDAKELRQKYHQEGIVGDIKSEIGDLNKIAEADRTQKDKDSLKSLSSILEKILGEDDNLIDIISKLKEEPPVADRIIDRDTQMAFKYNFEGDDEIKKLKRELIARLIKKRLAENGLDDLKVKVSGGTTIGIIEADIDKETAVKDILKTAGLHASEAIYFGDEFTPGGNDEPVTRIQELNIISANANPETTPEGVMWAGMGPEATRATLGWILQELEEIGEKEPDQVEPVISAVRRQIRVHTRGAYFFTREAMSYPRAEIDDGLIRNLKRMLREGFSINVISRKSIESEKSTFINKIDPELRRNLVVYCRLKDSQFRAYRFNSQGDCEVDDKPLLNKAEIVKERLKELGAGPEECIYVGDSFQTGSDRVIIEEPEFAERINIVNISSGRYTPVENMVLTGEGPNTTRTILDWIINDFLSNMKKFPLQRQKPIIELLAKRLFAEDAIRILKDVSREDAQERLRPLLEPMSKHYLGSMLGERGIQPLSDFIEAIRRGEQYHDEAAVINNVKDRVIRSLNHITGSNYGDLLAIYNYDYGELNEAIDRLIAETGSEWNELIKAGTQKDDANPYRQRLIATRGGEVTDKPQVLLMVGGTGGKFLVGTLPFSEILKLKSKGFRIAMGVTPHDDGGSSRRAQEALYPFMGYFPSPGDTINVYSGLVSSGKKKVLRWRFDKEQKGFLRSNMLTILNRTTELARKITITGCNEEAKVFDLAGSFFKVKYEGGAYHFMDISTDREVAAVEMAQEDGVSKEFSLNGNRFKVIQAAGAVRLVNSSITLDADWPFFCNAMLRLSQYMDDNIFQEDGLSMGGGSVGNFVLIGNNIESGAYKVRTETEDGVIKLVKLPNKEEKEKVRVKPDDYSQALQRLSEALGVTNGYAVPSTFDRGTFYVKLKEMALLGIKAEGEPVKFDPEGKLSEPLRTESDKKVSFEYSTERGLIIRVNQKKAVFAENNFDKIYTEGNKISSSTVVLNIADGEELIVGQGGDTTVTATPGKDNIRIEIARKDFKSGKIDTVPGQIDYGKDKEILYPKKDKTIPLGTAFFRIEKKDGGLEAHITLDRRGQGTMVTIGGVEITFKPRLIVEQTNITESLHLSPIEELGFINGVKPKANPDFKKLIEQTEDVVVMGPGSLTTSLMPILLVKENVEALCKRRQEGLSTLFVVNPYRDNETVGFTVTDIIKYVERVTGKRFEELFSHILINKPLDVNLIRKELELLKAERKKTSKEERLRLEDDIEKKEKKLKKAEEMLPLYNEMEIVQREHPEKLASRDPSDFSGLAKLSRGAIEATDQEVMELGKRGVTVYRVSVADIIESEVRQAGGAGAKKSVGYSSKSIARIIDEILFEKALLKDDERWRRLLGAFDDREEELIGTVEGFVRRTGKTYIEAIDRISEHVAMQESEVGELPRLLIANVNYTLIRGMDTKMDTDTAENVAEYLEGGGKIIILSGIGLYQMMEWIIEPLAGVLGDKRALLKNILLAPYRGTKVFKFDNEGRLDTRPLYALSEKIIPETMRRWEKEVDDAWSLLIDTLGIANPGASSFDILEGQKQVEMPIIEKRSDAEYRGGSISEQANRAVYFTFRMGRKGELWRNKHNLSAGQQRDMFSLNDLPEAAALEIFSKLTKRKEIQTFFRNTYGIDDFSDKGQARMVQVMLNRCKTGRLGRYSLKIVIGEYLRYRFKEAGIGNLVTVSYKETINDINMHLSHSKREALEVLFSNPYIKEQFIGEDVVKNQGRDVLLTGRHSIDALNLIPEARVYVFDTQDYTLAATDYSKEAISKRVAFYNGPLGSRGFTQLLDKMLSAVETPDAADNSGIKFSSAGSLNLDNIDSLTPQALEEAITSAKGILEEVLSDSKLAAEISELGVSGTIVINDESIPQSQREVVSSLYKEGSPTLRELERLTGCIIRLKSQLNRQDIKGELIIISDTQIEGFKQARYLMINDIPKKTDGYLPLAPLVGIAKALLGIEDKAQISDSLEELYHNLCRKPLTDKIIEEYLNNGIFSLELPKPEAYDYQKLELLQRQALAALIAA